jgi:hypothetical protein
MAAVLALVAATTASASASPYAPPPGRVFTGVTGGDFGAYEAAVGKPAAIDGQFTAFYGKQAIPTFYASAARATRQMLHYSTDVAAGSIAHGATDAFWIRENKWIAGGGRPVYIRLMSEMNGNWNPYCAYSANGRSRGPARSTASFRKAWQRIVLITRGGPVGAIDTKLHRLGMPPVRTREAQLARAPVSFLWVPQTAGNPDTRANSAAAYWPGAKYVDWVGTDFYSKFPNFAGLDRFYVEFSGKPLAFGEWAIWGRDDPAFVDRFFNWVDQHRRVQILMYNQGQRADGPFNLVHYPKARKRIRARLRGGRFLSSTPD